MNRGAIVALGVVGLFYGTLPHAIHMRYSPDYVLFNGIYGLPHWAHVTFGWTVLIGLAWYLCKEHKQQKG